MIDFSTIRILIVRVEGKHADHLTTTAIIETSLRAVGGKLLPAQP